MFVVATVIIMKMVLKEIITAMSKGIGMNFYLL
jgi:hypothetical protein